MSLFIGKDNYDKNCLLLSDSVHTKSELSATVPNTTNYFNFDSRASVVEYRKLQFTQSAPYYYITYNYPLIAVDIDIINRSDAEYVDNGSTYLRYILLFINNLTTQIISPFTHPHIGFVTPIRKITHTPGVSLKITIVYNGNISAAVGSINAFALNTTSGGIYKPFVPDTNASLLLNESGIYKNGLNMLSKKFIVSPPVNNTDLSYNNIQFVGSVVDNTSVSLALSNHQIKATACCGNVLFDSEISAHLYYNNNKTSGNSVVYNGIVGEGSNFEDKYIGHLVTFTNKAVMLTLYLNSGFLAQLPVTLNEPAITYLGSPFPDYYTHIGIKVHFIKIVNGVCSVYERTYGWCGDVCGGSRETHTLTCTYSILSKE